MQLHSTLSEYKQILLWLSQTTIQQNLVGKHGIKDNLFNLAYLDAYYRCFLWSNYKPRYSWSWVEDVFLNNIHLTKTMFGLTKSMFGGFENPKSERH